MPSPISKRMTVSTFFAYMKTWSAWKNFREKNPEKPDPLIGLEARILAQLESEGVKEGRDALLDVYWPTVLLLGKKNGTLAVENLA